MQRAIQRNALPGGVALVRHHSVQILLRAYGLSRKYDSLITLSSDPIPATTDTLYDLASLSKLFTTTVIMRLVEQGRLALDEPVAHWMPEFAAGGKETVTLRQLLTHTSGLPDYLKLWELEPTPEARIQRVLVTPLIHKPDTVFLYSDLGLIALGHLAEVITGSRLDALVRDMVTAPLHLGDTMYRPPADLKPRIAPTEDESNVGRGMVWGEVHDENAWSLGGVAGHAGVFSTAQDLGRFAQMYLNGGVLDGTRLLQSDTVAEMTRNQIEGIDWRGLGWELNADYYMGQLASPTTYGHTGFTGTSLVVDPGRELIVVLLTNRVHPTRNGPNMNSTRQAVANAAMAAADAAASTTVAVTTPMTTATPSAGVLTGVDVVLRDGLDLFKGRALGLVTNATGRTRDGRSTIDALNERPEWRRAALFSPEHGIRGEAQAGETVDSTTDAATGLPIYSLYGNTTRPTDAMLKGVEVLVYDIQDVGARTYTYISTLLEVMRAAAAHRLPVVVLDRPDPIGGDQVDGNVLDSRFASFVGPAPIAMRYGMSIGELAEFFDGELGVGCELHVVALEGWQRTMWFDDTGLEWMNPSPNIRSVDAAALYPGMVLFEGTNLSEGRGTPRPFEWIGAPWLDPAVWTNLSAPGVTFTPTDRTPDSSKYAGQVCHGVSIEVVDRAQLRPMDTAVAMIAAVGHGLQFDASTFDGLAGTDQVRAAIESGASADQVASVWQADLQRFGARRARYLRYS